jgi:exosortase
MSIATHKRFLLFVILSVAAWSQALHALIRLAIHDDDYSYTLLVLVISVVLLGLEHWPDLSYDRLSIPARVVGVLALCAAAWSIFRYRVPDGSLALAFSIFLWIVFLLAAFIGFYGWSGFRRLRFPFLFSFLAIPPTTRVIAALTSALQWGSADATALLLKLFHVPFARDGLLFSFSNLDILVAEECSSIRSSTILVVTTIVLAHLFLRTTSRRWIAILISIPVAVLKNGVRIFVLSVLAEYISIGWLDSRLHHQGGVIFLALGILIMLAVIWLLSRSERRPRPKSEA